jgi:DNA-binding SARP family transcriptional activator
VFAVLADHRGRLVTRDELIENVWGTTPPASVDSNVHTYIAGLRRVLEPERARWSGGKVLVSEPSGYRLRLSPHSLDLMVFECLRELAGTHEAHGDHANVVRHLDSALALWRGEAFGGVPGPYAERRRAELAGERLVVVEQRINSLISMGEYNDVVPELEALAREHPLRESVWESLITALHRGGRRAEALERIAHLRGVVREQLGVEPGAAIHLLQKKLLNEEPAAEPARTVPRRRPHPELLSITPDDSTRSKLVGRDAETAKLRSCVSDVGRRRGRVVLVEGEAGVGKTALLSAALTEVVPFRCHLGWSAGARRTPLGVLGEALGIKPHNAGALTMNEVLKRVEQLCVSAPLVLVRSDQIIAVATHRSL